MSDEQTTPTPRKSSSSSSRSSAATPAATSARASSPSSSSPATSSSPLKTELGTTTIADIVVSKVVAMAAREVDGVAELGGALSGAISGVVGRLRGEQHRTQGIGVEVGQTQAAVDLRLKVLYPASIRQVADAVRQSVDDRITELTGLEVVEVNIEVIDLVFPGEESEEGAEESAPPAQKPAPVTEPAARRVQ